MKKFTKVVIIISGILVAIAIGCVIVSVGMGLTWGSVSDMIKNNRFNIIFDDEREEIEEHIEHITDDVVDTNNNKDSVEKITQDFKELEIDFGEGTLELVYADVTEVQIERENLNHYRCYVRENTLHIESKSGVHIGSNDGTLKVLVPKTMVLNEVDVEIGAGVADIENVVANQFDIVVGAGKANVTGVDVKKLDAEVGAGSLKIQMVGSETDYSYEAEYGIGKLTIGQTEMNGIGGEKNFTNPVAKRHMDLECGLGELIIEFQQ